MHIKPVLFILGVLLFCLGLALLVPWFTSFYYADGANTGILLTLMCNIVLGFGLAKSCKPKEGEELFLNHREGFAIVGICWLVVSFMGSLPFVFSGQLGLTDAFFESASGFTTTGATILKDIEVFPKSLLLWRSLTHWLGGLGIIVLSLVILPLLGVGGMQLYKAEVSGPNPDKLTPRMHDTAIMLWRVYIILTVAEIALLCLAGMDFFDSVNHSFSTVATGGFSTKNASIAYYTSPFIQWIIIVFMFLAGASFALHVHFMRNGWKAYAGDREFRTYAGLLLMGGGIIIVSLLGHKLFSLHWGWSVFSELETILRVTFFQLISICTTTGFVSENYAVWPTLCLFILLLFTFLGGSAGSTSGGLKTMRLMMLWKMAYAEVFRLLHPHSVRHLKFNRESIKPDVVNGVMGFFLLYVSIIIIVTLLLTCFNLDLVTAFTASLTCIANVGPGLGLVGPVDNFSHLPALVKWILSVTMLLGRLEIYAIIILLVPEFWRK